MQDSALPMRTMVVLTWTLPDKEPHMRHPRLMGRGTAIALLSIGLFWLTPDSSAFLIQTNGHAVCVELCRIIVETCRIECMQGGSPPEFNPAGCMVECNPLMAACVESCRS